MLSKFELAIRAFLWSSLKWLLVIPAAAGLSYGVGVPAMQIFRWLKDGFWTAEPLSKYMPETMQSIDNWTLLGAAKIANYVMEINAGVVFFVIGCIAFVLVNGAESKADDYRLKLADLAE